MAPTKQDETVIKLDDEELLILDGYIANQPGPKLSRREALRNIIEDVKFALTFKNR